jgi:hypothetical protein
MKKLLSKMKLISKKKLKDGIIPDPAHVTVDPADWCNQCQPLVDQQVLKWI